MTIAKIADSLSEAQRRAVLEARDMMSSPGGYPFFTVRYTREPWPMGIAQFITLKTDRLTPLGVQVRAHLKEQEHGKA